MELPPIVVADWAEAHRVVWCDVRWYLDGRPGHDAFAAGHIPGAVYVDLDTDLATHGPAAAGRHPLPSPEAFAATLGRLGIGDHDPVVAYDDSGGMSAGRMVWMLRVLGRPAALLDGGLAAWSGPLETGPAAARPPAAATPRPWPEDRFVDHDGVQVAAAGPDAVVLDARSTPRYAGDDTSVDPRPGHIPGAANAHWSANLDAATGRFRAVDDLRSHYGELGIGPTTEVVCYCGSGVSACADLLALEHIGVERTRLFVPSWSGWSADPARPAALGRR